MLAVLRDFQKKTVEYGIKNPYCIFALQQGLGKSLCAISVAEETKSRTLIVCPAYLRLKWKMEIDKFFPGRVVTIFDSHKDIYFPVDSDYVIIGYSALDKSECLFEWAELVVFDECHYLKELRTKRTEAAHRLIFENSIKRCLLLSGTPITNRVYEFYSPISICNYNPTIEKSEFLDKYKSYVDFANHFSYLKEYEIMRGGKRVKVQQWEGLNNKDELKKWLEGIYIRFRSDEVLDLPPYLEIDVPLVMEDMPELLEEFENFVEGNEGVGSSAKAKAALLKAPYTVEYVKDLLESGGPVVVYSDHVEACERIAEGLGVPAITGKMKVEERQRLANEFMAGKSKVIVATIKSFSTGIDLFISNTMVFNDFSFVPGDMEQAMFRIIRVGQKNRCFFHYIIGTPQDTIILKEKLPAKKKVIAEAT